MSEHISAVSDGDFEQEVLQAKGPVLVDFWAEWCGPCKALMPVLEEAANSHHDKIKFTKLNIDDNQNTPAKYGVRGIPTLIIFKDGNVEASKTGSLTLSQLNEFIGQHI